MIDPSELRELKHEFQRLAELAPDIRLTVAPGPNKTMFVLQGGPTDDDETPPYPFEKLTRLIVQAGKLLGQASPDVVCPADSRLGQAILAAEPYDRFCMFVARRQGHRLRPNAPYESAVLPRFAQAAELAIDQLLSHPKVSAATQGRQRANRKRKQPSADVKPLTVKQAQAVQVVGECEGNYAKAAKRLGVDRTTVKEHYLAAMAKLGQQATRGKPKKQRLPTDRRGQSNIAEDTDRRQ